MKNEPSRQFSSLAAFTVAYDGGPWLFDKLQLRFPSVDLSGVQFINASGEDMRVKQGVFKVFAEKLNFPDYFGNNWNAMDECIRNMEWAQNKNILFLIYRAEDLMTDTDMAWLEEQTSILFDVMLQGVLGGSATIRFLMLFGCEHSLAQHCLMVRGDGHIRVI
jgi:hypothetical protein